MSWLNDIERVYFFKCRACEEESGIIRSKFDPDTETAGVECDKCNVTGKLEYTGWDNVEDFHLSSQISKISYEQNGRKAYKIGNTYLSKTKYDYLETGKVENKYTTDYERKLRDDEEKNEYLLKSETNKKRAIVTELKREITRRAHSKSGSKTVPKK